MPLKHAMDFWIYKNEPEKRKITNGEIYSNRCLFFSFSWPYFELTKKLWGLRCNSDVLNRNVQNYNKFWEFLFFLFFLKRAISALLFKPDFHRTKNIWANCFNELNKKKKATPCEIFSWSVLRVQGDIGVNSWSHSKMYI